MGAMPSILSVYYQTIRSGLTRERGEVEVEEERVEVGGGGEERGA